MWRQKAQFHFLNVIQLTKQQNCFLFKTQSTKSYNPNNTIQYQPLHTLTKQNLKRSKKFNKKSRSKQRRAYVQNVLRLWRAITSAHIYRFPEHFKERQHPKHVENQGEKLQLFDTKIASLCLNLEEASISKCFFSLAVLLSKTIVMAWTLVWGVKAGCWFPAFLGVFNHIWNFLASRV